jgi:hypothetical protein
MGPGSDLKSVLRMKAKTSPLNNIRDLQSAKLDKKVDLQG